MITQVLHYWLPVLDVCSLYWNVVKQKIGLAVMQYKYVAQSIAAIGLIGFIIYELSIKNPAVNLRVLGNRNLAFTTVFTFVAGFGLFTSVFVYPVLAQRVLGIHRL